MRKTGTLRQALSPIHSQSGPSRTVSSIALQQGGPRTHSFQAETQVLECFATFLATCVAATESTKSGPTDLERFRAAAPRPLFRLGCELVLRRLPVLRIQVVWPITSRTLAAIICDADDPCSVIHSAGTGIVLFKSTSDHEAPIVFLEILLQRRFFLR